MQDATRGTERPVLRRHGIRSRKPAFPQPRHTAAASRRTHGRGNTACGRRAATHVCRHGQSGNCGAGALHAGCRRCIILQCRLGTYGTYHKLLRRHHRAAARRAAAPQGAPCDCRGIHHLHPSFPRRQLHERHRCRIHSLLIHLRSPAGTFCLRTAHAPWRHRPPCAIRSSSLAHNKLCHRLPYIAPHRI